MIDFRIYNGGRAAATIAPLIGVALVLAWLAPQSALAAEHGKHVCKDDLDLSEYLDDPDAIAYGKERFGMRCVYCHGGGGMGAKGPALVKGKFKHGYCNEDIVGNIASGIPNTQMGAFGRSLDYDEILKIVSYLRDEERKHREAGDFK